jgi:hypothetical protein
MIEPKGRGVLDTRFRGYDEGERSYVLRSIRFA